MSAYAPSQEPWPIGTPFPAWEGGRGVRSLRPVTTLYLLLPLVPFAFAWLRGPFNLIVVAVLAIALASAVRDLWRCVWLVRVGGYAPAFAALRWVAPAALLLLGWLLLSGAGGLGHQNDDYASANALFKQLILSPWPPKFTFEGETVPVVYYLAYYLPAALVGKLLGWQAAHAALWLWTALGLALSFAWFAALSGLSLRGQARRTLALAVLFAFAGGLDFIGLGLQRGAPPAPTEHLEFWAGFFQFSSNTTLLYWVPQQALAAWLLTALVLDALLHPHDLRYLSLALAAGLLWTPLGVLGLVPLVVLLAAVCLLSARRCFVLRPASLLFHAAALGLAAVLALYLSANRLAFPAGPIWQGVADPVRLARYYLAFWVLEFGGLALLLAGCLWLLHRSTTLSGGFGPMDTWPRPLHLAVFALSVLTLTFLPLLRFGFNNDLSMRGSIPSLFVLWLLAGQVLLRPLPVSRPPALLLLRLLLAVVVLLGFVPALTEIIRSVTHYRLGPPPLAAVAPMAEADRPHLVAQRAGDPEAFFFRHLGR